MFRKNSLGLIIAIQIPFCFGCASFRPVPFATSIKFDKNQVVFTGNLSTPYERAEAYSQAAIVQACLKKGLFPVVGTPTGTEDTFFTRIKEDDYYSEPLYSGQNPILSRPFTCMPFVMNSTILDSDTVRASALRPFTGDRFGGLLVKRHADQSVFKQGDVILGINNRRVSDLEELHAEIELEMRRKQKSARVRLIRKNRVITITFPLHDVGPSLLVEKFIPEFIETCEKYGSSDSTLSPLCNRTVSSWKDILEAKATGNSSTLKPVVTMERLAAGN